MKPLDFYHNFCMCAQKSQADPAGTQTPADGPAPWEHDKSNVRVGHESDCSYRLWAERYKGYVDTLRAHGIPLDHDLIQNGNAWFENNVNSGMTCMERLMELEQPPMAIYAGNDLFALAGFDFYEVALI